MKKEYFAALEALNIARNHFEHAETDFIEAAVMELCAAEKRFEAVRNGYLG